MKSVVLFRILILFAALGFSTVMARAADLATVKARMEQRVAAIDALKDRKVVGENNHGYLEARGSVNGEEQRIISDENSDRRVAYAALAAQTKTDIDTVGRQRAQQLAMRSKRGVWVQAPDGQWRQKA